METRITEIADGAYQLTTYSEAIDFSLNQYLLTGDEPLLFHTGTRESFALVSEAVGRIMPLDELRWISFGHVEADECGSLDQWLAAAPHANVAQGAIGCMVSIGDLTGPDRPPRPLAAGELLDIGGHAVEWIDTGTTTDDIVEPAIAAEDIFASMSLHPTTAAAISGLAERDIATLAPMHAPAFAGDCRAALHDLAADADRRVQSSRWTE